MTRAGVDKVRTAGRGRRAVRRHHRRPARRRADRRLGGHRRLRHLEPAPNPLGADGVPALGERRAETASTRHPRRARPRPARLRRPAGRRRRLRALRPERRPRPRRARPAATRSTEVTWVAAPQRRRARCSVAATDDQLARAGPPRRRRPGRRRRRGSCSLVTGFRIERGRPTVDDGVVLAVRRTGARSARSTGSSPPPGSDPTWTPLRELRLDVDPALESTRALGAADRPERPQLRVGPAPRRRRARPPRTRLLHRRRQELRAGPDVPARHRLRAGPLGRRRARRRPRRRRRRAAGPPRDRRVLARPASRRRRRRCAAPAAAELAQSGGGPRRLRRATLTLAATQLVSWGVLFYGFAVVAPEVTADTGWSEAVVAGAFSVGPAGRRPRRASGRPPPRRAATPGSSSPPDPLARRRRDARLRRRPPPRRPLRCAWVVIGLAMAATLYEPAMAVLVALDPSPPAPHPRDRHRRRRAGSAPSSPPSAESSSTTSDGAPLWSSLAVGGRARVTTAAARLRAPAGPTIAAPPSRRRPSVLRVPPRPAAPGRAAVRAGRDHRHHRPLHRAPRRPRARPSRSPAPPSGSWASARSPAGSLLLGPVVRSVPLASLAAGCNVVQLAGLAVPLADLRPAAPDRRRSDRRRRVRGHHRPASAPRRRARRAPARTRPSAPPPARHDLARAGAPFAIGAGAAVLGWPTTWALALVAFGIAADRLPRLGDRGA